MAVMRPDEAGKLEVFVAMGWGEPLNVTAIC